MVDVELKRKVRISREDAARRLITSARPSRPVTRSNWRTRAIRSALSSPERWSGNSNWRSKTMRLNSDRMKWSNSPSAEAAPAPEPTATEKAAAVADEG